MQCDTFAKFHHEYNILIWKETNTKLEKKQQEKTFFLT